MHYEWDESKQAKNLQKHGLSFQDAQHVLDGPCLTLQDDRFDYGETRFVSIGLLRGRAVVIAYTARSGAIRIVSMRKANGRERKLLEERLGSNRSPGRR